MSDDAFGHIDPFITPTDEGGDRSGAGSSPEAGAGAGSSPEAGAGGSPGGSPEAGAGAGAAAGTSLADLFTSPGAGDLETPTNLQDLLGTMPQGGGMPTPQDMASTNASDAEARAQAIKDGMDEGTADILYPQFSTPEDMLKIN